jgi:GNAT superfamily N-acetyltransferase
MDAGRYSIRPFADLDYESVARINSIALPEYPETAEDIRHWSELTAKEPGRLMRKLIVEEDASGAVVAWGGLNHTFFNYHPHKYYIRVVVHPEHRGRGIGRELYDRLEQEAISRRAICLWGGAREDEPACIRFLERQGFVAQRKAWTSRLSLAHLDRSKLPDRSKALSNLGIQVTTFAAEGADRADVQRRIYELSRITSEGAPRMGDYNPVSFEEFVEIDLQGATVLPDAIFLARAGEEYVSWTTLQRLRALPDTLDIGFTGTLPSFRGQGIASELKRRAVEYAQDHGYRYIITGNDSLNPGIWAINEKLGFRREMVMVQAEKQLEPSEP